MAGRPTITRVDIKNMQLIKQMLDNPLRVRDPLTVDELLAMTMRNSGATMREIQQSMDISQQLAYKHIDRGMTKTINYLKEQPMKQ